MSDKPSDNPWNPLAWVVGSPDIGDGTWIGPFCLIDASGGLTIGAGCDIAAGAHIYTHSTVARCVTDRRKPNQHAPVVIGPRTFVGANAVILMGVTIGTGCVIAAGAVVTRDVPDYCWVAGVPATRRGRVEPDSGRLISDAPEAPTSSTRQRL
jgi:acetyltransferase-like isoleucine patch superfamily enzyme